MNQSCWMHRTPTLVRLARRSGGNACGLSTFRSISSLPCAGDSAHRTKDLDQALALSPELPLYCLNRRAATPLQRWQRRDVFARGRDRSADEFPRHTIDDGGGFTHTRFPTSQSRVGVAPNSSMEGIILRFIGRRLTLTVPRRR